MPLDLKALRELHARTTPGTWEKGSHTHDGWVIYSNGRRSIIASDMSTANIEFAVAAHEQWVEMLDELDTSTAHATKVQALLDELEDRQRRIEVLSAIGDYWKAELESLRAEVARLKEKAGET